MNSSPKSDDAASTPFSRLRVGECVRCSPDDLNQAKSTPHRYPTRNAKGEDVERETPNTVVIGEATFTVGRVPVPAGQEDTGELEVTRVAPPAFHG